MLPCGGMKNILSISFIIHPAGAHPHLPGSIRINMKHKNQDKGGGTGIVGLALAIAAVIVVLALLKIYVF